jgi:hypothetical protein
MKKLDETFPELAVIKDSPFEPLLPFAYAKLIYFYTNVMGKQIR